MTSETHVIIYLAIFACIIFSYLFLSDRIRSKEKQLTQLEKDVEALQEAYAKAVEDLEESIKDNVTSIGALKERSYNKIDDLHKEISDYNRANTDLRNKDNLEFLKALGEFNLTLTKFDSTLKHFDKTLIDLNNRVHSELAKLEGKIKQQEHMKV